MVSRRSNVVLRSAKERPLVERGTTMATVVSTSILKHTITFERGSRFHSLGDGFAERIDPLAAAMSTSSV